MKVLFRSAVLLLPLAASLAQSLKVGEPAPPLTFRETIPAGVDAGWATLRGKPVVLEFWATWCGNCIAHIPAINELAAKFPQIQFISISDEEPAPVKAFIAKEPISGWVAVDSAKATFQAYGVEGRPQTMLIDKDGSLRGIMHPAQLTGAVLDDLTAGRPIAPQRLMVRPPALDTSADPVFAMVLRPSASPKRGGMLGIDPGMLRAENIDLKTIMSVAYAIPTGRLEGPREFLSLRYDYCVLLPAGMTGDWELLRMLLERSLRLTLRRERREVVDAVVLKRSGAQPEIYTQGWPIRLLASNVESRLKRMVIDETGLDGFYNLSMPDSPDAIATVLRRLGIEMVYERRPLEVLVVDSITLPTFRTVGRR